MKIINNNLSVSQNFLVHSDFVEKLINLTSINKDDLVLEIGAGKGIITEILSKKAGDVVAVEYDKNLSSYLLHTFQSVTNVKIVNEDFLNFRLPNKQYKVFANPPFNISADIINKLLSFPNKMDVAYLILQEETVSRFVDNSNQISILYAPFYKISVIDKIKKTEFNPVPKVNIVLSEFKKRNEYLINLENYQLYRDFVIYGYNQWKPTLVEALDKVFTKVQLNIISKKYKLENLKPSELNVETWVSLFNSFLNYVSDDKKILVRGFENKYRARQNGMQKRHRTNLNENN